MRIAVLAAPTVSEKSVRRFKCTPEIELSHDINAIPSPDAALIFGGDGTVHRHLPVLYASKIPVLVVPKGSGNDFAHALGIHSERAALRAWRQFCCGKRNLREIDLGLIRKDNHETPFCCVVGAGLDAQANARANRMPAWLRRSAGYLVAAIQALLSSKPVDLEVTTAHGCVKSAALLIAVGNAHRYGGGVKIVPRASMDDGLLDICVVRSISKLKVLFCLPIIYFGGHTRLKEVDYFRADKLAIGSRPPLEVYADGEFVCDTPVEIGLVPKALRVIVPPETVLDSCSSLALKVS